MIACMQEVSDGGIIECATLDYMKPNVQYL